MAHPNQPTDPNTPRCHVCDCWGCLVSVTCSRSDTCEVLMSQYLCPDCFLSSDFEDIFGGEVIGHDADGVNYVLGDPPREE